MSLHTLALELGYTVSRIKNEMPLSEYLDWIAFYSQRNNPSQPTKPEPEPLTAADVARAFKM